MQSITREQERQVEPGSANAYAPSWINRLNGVVDRLSVPFPLIYFAVWALFYLTVTFLRWSEGVYPAGLFNGSEAVMSGTGIFFIALIHYLDKWAGRQLHLFRKALDVGDREFQQFAYQLSTLPTRPVIIAGLVTFAVGATTFLLSPASYGFLHLNLSTLSGALQLANFLFSWYVFGALSYHAYHQLNLGSRATTDYVQINLFNLDPIYAFAGLTLRTALGWLIMAYAWALTTPDLMGNLVIGATILFMQVVAILTFVLPLLNAHGRIVDCKSGLQHDIGARIESVIRQMGQGAGAQSKDELALLKEKLSTLLIAEERLQKLSTWPWRAGTINSLATAILIPNIIWLLQIVLERLMMQ